MATRKRTTRPTLVRVHPTRSQLHRINEVTHELYEIDALLNGADSIVRDIQETGTGPAADLDYDAMNAHKLLRAAIARIPALGEMIENLSYLAPAEGDKEAANG